MAKAKRDMPVMDLAQLLKTTDTLIDYPLKEKTNGCAGCPYEMKGRKCAQVGLPKGSDILIVLAQADKDEVADREHAAQSPYFRYIHDLIRYIRSTNRQYATTSFSFAYAIACSVEKGKGKAPEAAKQCGNLLTRYLNEKAQHLPKAILLMGSTAAKSFGLNDQFKNLRGTINNYKFNGKTVPVVVTYGYEDLFKQYDGKDIIKETHLISTMKIDLLKALRVAECGYKPVDVDQINSRIQFPKGLAAIALLEHMLTKKLVAFDIETTGLNPRADDAAITTLSLAWGPNPEDCAAIDLRSASRQLLDAVKDFLLSDIPKIAHNAKFDISYILVVWGYLVNKLVGDTMLCHYLADENRVGDDTSEIKSGSFAMKNHKGEYTLKKLVWDYIPEYGGYEHSSDISKLIKAGQMNLIDHDKLMLYAAIDALVTWVLYSKQKRLLNDIPLSADANEVSKIMLDRKNSLSQLFILSKTLMTDAVYALVSMETEGMGVDLPYVNNMAKRLRTEIGDLQKGISNLIPVVLPDTLHPKQKRNKGLPPPKFTSSNPAHMRWLLFNHLQLKSEKKTKTGFESADAETLKKMAGSHPIIDKLLRISKLKKLDSSFVQNVLKLRSTVTGRVHPSFKLEGTVTGRLSCSEPNLQQIPKEMLDYNVKKIFSPPPGRIFITADYSQIEVAILACYAHDPVLHKAILDGLDMHCFSAGKMFNIPYEEMFEKGKIKEIKEFANKRTQAKKCTFGIIYGVTKFGLSRQIAQATKEDFSEDQAQNLIDMFLDLFPGIKDYVRETHELARRNKEVDTLFGRKRRLPILFLDPGNRRALRQAQNSRIQSTASDLTLTSVTRLSRELPILDAKLVCTVHDSIIGEGPDNPVEVQKIAALFQDIMITRPTKEYSWLKVPIAIDLKVGYSWGEEMKLKQYLETYQRMTEAGIAPRDWAYGTDKLQTTEV